MTARPKLLVIAGPTACGKTRLAVALARAFGGEIVSADSRQAYRALDLCAGKDLEEYRTGGPVVPVHLVDVAELSEEFSLFDFVRGFARAFWDICAHGRLPILCGGTGLYLEAVLRGYRLAEAAPDDSLRAELSQLSAEELKERLRAEKPRLHNVSDFGSRERTIRAIEIAVAARTRPALELPAFEPLVIGVSLPRPARKLRIRERLRARLAAGMLEEVRRLLDAGVTHPRLEELGLECRFISRFLRGEIPSQDELEERLSREIYLFSKRQEAWLRRWERAGMQIHWLEGPDVERASAVVREVLGARPPGGES
ncbi:MAG: tRNA dimethylallyltransferase [Myxococcales bacterium]|nr:tRNA dimethylallyltransferase [Myxococcales bacterium]